MEENNAQMNETAVFAGGCFWCTEEMFKNLKGVSSVLPGYTGGATASPSYEDVSSGSTGHAEAVKIEFDPSQIKFADLLEVFFATHDPTTLNRQGNDIGTQYRSAIFYTSSDQQHAASDIIKKLEAEKVFSAPIVTEVVPLANFYVAEDYHKNYYERNSGKPYCQLVISPKVAKLRQKFSALLKNS